MIFRGLSIKMRLKSCRSCGSPERGCLCRDWPALWRVQLQSVNPFLPIVLCLMLATTGCSNPLRTQYGKSRGVDGEQSINGLGVLRRSYEKNGWTTREVNRLNNRLSNVQAIVWTPTYRDGLYDDATKWFDEWLGEETRTLVYVVPDEGCEIQYYETARQLAPPKQKLEYCRHIARLETDQMLERVRDESISNNGWFTLERLPRSATVDGAKGEWQINTKNKLIAAAVHPLPVAYKVVTAPIVTTPSTPPPPSYGKYGRQAGTTSVEVEHTTLLSANDGSPAIVRVTADEWRDSKIIVVGSSSLLCNFSLASQPGQTIAAELIAETGNTPGMIGFLSTDFRGAPVSDIDPEINAVTGMELLTVWPLSLIVLHLAVMGFVACMILLPIFGRPREVQEASSSDFADHLDAVAALMNKSGGEEYARLRVSDYMRRIRGESTGAWVLPDLKPPITTTTAPSPTKE